MKMPESKLELLRTAHSYCDEEDKSTEFMLQYMQDFAGVDLDTMMYYLENSEQLRFQKS